MVKPKLLMLCSQSFSGLLKEGGYGRSSIMLRARLYMGIDLGSVSLKKETVSDLHI